MRASIQIREEEHFETILGYSAAAGPAGSWHSYCCLCKKHNTIQKR